MQSAHAVINEPWAVVVYYGPSNTKFFGAVTRSGFDQRGPMLGLSVTRQIWDLGSDISFGTEGKVTHYFGHENTSVALGIGLQFCNIFGLTRISFSIYSGPSYATDPPSTSIGYRGVVYPAEREKYLNHVGMELAIGLPQTSKWDGVLRLYHRSGVFGLYSINNDDGLALGVGFRHNFYVIRLKLNWARGERFKDDF